MNKKILYLFLCCLSVLSSCRSGSKQEPHSGPPNIVILFCDDLGYGDLSGFGNPLIRTPHLDRLAAEGTKFTQFYSTSPACTASRYALLTGRYPVHAGFPWVLYPASSRGLHPNEQTIAEQLKGAGYATAAFGKWHLGSTKPEFLPLQQGFDEYLGLPYSNDMIPPKWQDIALLQNNDTLAMNPDQTTLTRRYTEQAIDFIERHQDQPFFVYLPYAMPHVPLHPGPEFAGRSRRGPYGDVVEEIDWSAGQIRQLLDSLGLAENTLLFFTSDNGPWIIKGDRGGSAGLLRDGKGSTWEGGMREPAIAWWPGTVPAGRVEATPLSTLDLYPTLMQLAGLNPDPPLHAGNTLDGQDRSALLTGQPDSLEARPFFFYGPGHRLQAVRLGKWKLHVHTNSQTGIDYFEGKIPLLFNLEADPSEKEDLSEAYPEVVDQLLALITAQNEQVARTPNLFELDRLAKRTVHIGTGKAATVHPDPNPRFGADSLLTDGLPGDAGNLATMVGLQGQNLEAIIDLGESLMIEKITAGFLNKPSQQVFLPKEIDVSVSLDGKQYRPQGHFTPPADTLGTEARIAHYRVEMRAKPVRYIRVCAKKRMDMENAQSAWIFVDEVVVE